MNDSSKNRPQSRTSKRILGLLVVLAALLVLWIPCSGLLIVLKRGFFSQKRAPDNVLPLETRNVLDQAETFTLYSLDPRSSDELEAEAKANPEAFFHDFHILGKTEIAPSERATLLDALYAGIADSRGIAAACFYPRHGIRAVLNSETVDLVICFECNQIRTHAKHGKNVLTTGWRQPVFDETLKKAGVPLPKPRGAGLSSEGEAAPSP